MSQYKFMLLSVVSKCSTHNIPQLVLITEGEMESGAYSQVISHLPKVEMNGWVLLSMTNGKTDRVYKSHNGSKWTPIDKPVVECFTTLDGVNEHNNVENNHKEDNVSKTYKVRCTYCTNVAELSERKPFVCDSCQKKVPTTTTTRKFTVHCSNPRCTNVTVTSERKRFVCDECQTNWKPSTHVVPNSRTAVKNS